MTKKTDKIQRTARSRQGGQSSRPQRTLIIVVITLVILTFLGGLLFVGKNFVGQAAFQTETAQIDVGQVAVNPTTGIVLAGDEFTVTVRGDVGQDAVTAAEAIVRYSNQELEFVQAESLLAGQWIDPGTISQKEGYNWPEKFMKVTHSASASADSAKGEIRLSHSFIPEVTAGRKLSGEQDFFRIRFRAKQTLDKKTTVIDVTEPKVFGLNDFGTSSYGVKEPVSAQFTISVGEDCSIVGDDDNNNLADCADPVCIDEVGPEGSVCKGSPYNCPACQDNLCCSAVPGCKLVGEECVGVPRSCATYEGMILQGGREATQEAACAAPCVFERNVRGITCAVDQEVDCSDGLDEDNNGYADCDDNKCFEKDHCIATDTDNDGLVNNEDTCPYDINSGIDADADGFDNVCDSDDDADGIPDSEDNCALAANPNQIDIDADGNGDVCDTDDDNDDVIDRNDNCPFDSNSDQADIDYDGQGDACDESDDRIDVSDSIFSCPILVPKTRTEEGYLGGFIDGACNSVKGCHWVGKTGTNDPGSCVSDYDRKVGGPAQSCADYSDFNSNVIMANDAREVACVAPCQFVDDGNINDICSTDNDNDGVDNGVDNCPNKINADQLDIDNDGLGDACDDIDDVELMIGTSCSLDSDCGYSLACEYGACLGAYPRECSDNYDCAQSKRYFCLASVCKQGKEFFCQDDLDNDGDGLIDCLDSDCLVDGTCKQGADADGDGIFDADDNCPNTGNTNQVDRDNDGQGDACDTDDDGDGISDRKDNCMVIANPDQLDTDSDQKGDSCDDDDDGDKVIDTKDNCPLVSNAGQADRDGDKLGDACDDSDNDGVYDIQDNCPTAPNTDQLNTDGDAQGDACDNDDDNDGVIDTLDNCPLVVSSSQIDRDSDGQGDACDTDDDNDGILDKRDNCWIIANPDQLDTDSDQKGDACDTDDDGDKVIDVRDNCPLVSNTDQADADGDSQGDACDDLNDKDGDSIADDVDNCPLNPNGNQADVDEDSLGDVCDSDNTDGPFGDSDGDSKINRNDNCPSVSNKNQLDTNNDGKGDACDTDDDGDGVADTQDNCPTISNANQADVDGDGQGDACDSNNNDGPLGDLDGDNVINSKDNCPGTINVEVDVNGCTVVQEVKLGDINGDSCVEISEVLTYISQWQSGEVSMPDLLTGIANWQSGEGC